MLKLRKYIKSVLQSIGMADSQRLMLNGKSLVIVARGFVSTNGFNLSVVPAFVELEIDGEKRTGVKFIVRNN